MSKQIKDELTRLVISELKELDCCIQKTMTEYETGETIMEYNCEKISQMAIIVSGEAIMYSVDINGNRNILENLDENSVFGEMFSFPGNKHTFYIKAQKKCKVLFLKYDYLLYRCGNNCEHHANVLSNLLHIVALKNTEIRQHLDILSQRSTRNRLMTYFAYLNDDEKNREIIIPMSWTDISDYLCVERSAMMRELKKMNEEGLIKSEGKKIRILKGEET